MPIHDWTRVEAGIEVVSPGNKASRSAVGAFVSKAIDFLRNGIPRNLRPSPIRGGRLRDKRLGDGPGDPALRGIDTKRRSSEPAAVVIGTTARTDGAIGMVIIENVASARRSIRF